MNLSHCRVHTLIIKSEKKINYFEKKLNKNKFKAP